MEFVKSANLPTKKVSHVICGYQKELYAALLEMGIASINPGQADCIENVTKYHSDLLCTHLGGRYVIVEKANDFLRDGLRDLGFNVVMSREMIGADYPLDCSLNCALIGKYLLCNIKTVDQSLLRYCNNNQYEIVHTEQGYTKCNTCIVNDEAIITSDLSIYTAMKGKIDILPIELGSIELEGFNYGFIGGATGLIDKNLLAFAGDLALHPCAAKIKTFLMNHNVDAVSLLPNHPLMDVGSILPVIEY